MGLPPRSAVPKENAPLPVDHTGPVLLRHDSEFSVGTNYDDGSPNNLNLWQGALLLTADCLGTGLLALPADVQVLGWGLGLGFLIANLPINLYAGTIFHHTATAVETRQRVENRLYHEIISVNENMVIDYREINSSTVNSELSTGSLLGDKFIDYETMNESTVNSALTPDGAAGKHVDWRQVNDQTWKSHLTGASRMTTGTAHTQLHHDTATFDFIGMTRALFKSKRAAQCVMIIYYTNIFLVLGNYILVMSHAVSAIFGGRLCYPEAGLLASTGMFVVSQSRTMARLGRAATVLSLSALFVVVCQCLWAAHFSSPSTVADTEAPPEYSLLRKLSALGSIGFAVGSQKLFLNIRHELSDRSVAPKSLALSLTIFGSVYVLIIVLAGRNPPSFLFDAIPDGINRQVAGFLLWAHVVVSYAINSQAICSSMDRLVWHRLNLPFSDNPARRWLVLTLLMAMTAYTVANAIPFFKDLVALIGSLTSVPLTLLLPAVFWRKHLRVPLGWPTLDSLWSYALTVFAVLFMVAATFGSLYSIEQDWSTRGKPFACK